MLLNCDVYNFSGNEAQASWRECASSVEEALSLFTEAAHACSYNRLTLDIEGKHVATAYRFGDEVEIVIHH